MIRALEAAPRPTQLIAVADRGPAIHAEAIIVPTAVQVAQTRDRSPELEVRLQPGSAVAAVYFPAGASAPRLAPVIPERSSTAGLGAGAPATVFSGPGAAGASTAPYQPGAARPAAAATRTAGTNIGQVAATTSGTGRPVPGGFLAARRAMGTEVAAAAASGELTVVRETQPDVRQSESTEQVKQPEAAPAQQALPTEPTASSTLSDGHTGTSTSAYLAAITLLLTLCLGLRVTLSGGLRPLYLTYAPPVPPG